MAKFRNLRSGNILTVTNQSAIDTLRNSAQYVALDNPATVEPQMVKKTKAKKTKPTETED